ncbi:MAG: hypothetical protein K2X68_09245, partial [Novosphingobium sp.]|nr:hypothetical protein [Novosphingobium sp.]
MPNTGWIEGPIHAAAGESSFQPVAGSQLFGGHLALAVAHEPAVACGGVDDFSHAVARNFNPPERLVTKAAERSFDPLAAPAEDPVRAASKLGNRQHAAGGYDTG